MNEKFLYLDKDTNLQIREELASIHLKEGECLVCGSKSVSDNLLVNVMKIFEKHKLNKEVIEEFRKLFFYS